MRDIDEYVSILFAEVNIPGVIHKEFDLEVYSLVLAKKRFSVNLS